MDSLKRALKGIFKRGNKKSKQEQEQDKTAQQQPQGHYETAPAEPAKAPQLPPHQNASPLRSPGSGEESPKALPPTHPLVTGQHSHPQEAVPIDHDAQPGPPPAPHDDAGVRGAGRTARPEETSHSDSRGPVQGATGETSLDPLAPQHPASQPEERFTGKDAAVNEPSDALEPAQKTDSAIGETEHGEHRTPLVQLPAILTETAERTPKDAAPPKTDGAIDASEEKVAVAHEEPPPIKAVRAAPGMSATSGPLEDFPEGGEHLHE